MQPRSWLLLILLRFKQMAIRYHWFCSHLGLKDGNGIIIKDVALALNKVGFLTKALAQSTFDKSV